MKTVSDLSGIEGVVRDTLNHIMNTDWYENPSDKDRSDLIERFSKDTVNLVLTFLVNNPEVLDQPYTGDFGAISSTLN